MLGASGRGADSPGVQSDERPAPLLFVSYARESAESVLPIVEALRRQGATAWVDTDDIEKSDDWWEEIRRNIRQADAFVVMLTPAYVSSSVCRDELEYASSTGKRLIPLLVEQLDDVRNTPDWLSPVKAINWIDLADGSHVDGYAADETVRVAGLDHEWTREHSRLLGLAEAWDASNRARSRLLRGRDVAAAELELATNRPDGQPQPSDLQKAYVLESRRHRGRLRSASLVVATLVTAGSLALAVVAIAQRREADQQRAHAQVAQAEAETAQAEAEASEARAVDAALLAEAEQRLGNSPEQALGLALESYARSGSSDAMSIIRRQLEALPYGSRFDHLAGGASRVVVAPDEQTVAVAYPNEVDLIDLEQVMTLRTITVDEAPSPEIEFVSDGTLVIVQGSTVAFVGVDADAPIQATEAPLPPSARIVRIRRIGADGALGVLWQENNGTWEPGMLHADLWTLNASSGDIEVAEARALGQVPYVESADLGPAGYFAATSTGSKWSFQDVEVRLFALGASSSDHVMHPVAIGFRPWSVLVDDRMCAHLAEPDSGCSHAEVTVTGEPYGQDRSGEVVVQSLTDDDWNVGTQVSLPSPLQVTAQCVELLVSGISGAYVVSNGSVYPAIIGTDPPAVACSPGGLWVVAEPEGTLLRSPRLREPETTVTGIAAGSWYVTEFSPVDDAPLLDPPRLSDVIVRSNDADALELSVDGSSFATSLPPVGRTVGSDLTVVAVSDDSDSSGLTGGLVSDRYEVEVQPVGLDWSRTVRVAERDSPDTVLFESLFPDAPTELAVMSDGSILGAFTFRGEYTVYRLLSFTDEYVTALSCAIGATMPVEVTSALRLDAGPTPTMCR